MKNYFGLPHNNIDFVFSLQEKISNLFLSVQGFRGLFFKRKNLFGILHLDKFFFFFFFFSQIMSLWGLQVWINSTSTSSFPKPWMKCRGRSIHGLNLSSNVLFPNDQVKIIAVFALLFPMTRIFQVDFQSEVYQFSPLLTNLILAREKDGLNVL